MEVRAPEDAKLPLFFYLQWLVAALPGVIVTVSGGRGRGRARARAGHAGPGLCKQNSSMSLRAAAAAHAAADSCWMRGLTSLHPARSCAICRASPPLTVQ